MKSLRALGFSIIAAVLWIGCATREQRNSLSDHQLEQRVKHVLSTQPVYKYPDVQVITSQGVVELKGSVSNDSQKELASEIVRSVRGVNQLENNISVVALDRERVREASP
jgi:osmotically-inducible protein OsmY